MSKDNPAYTLDEDGPSAGVSSTSVKMTVSEHPDIQFSSEYVKDEGSKEKKPFLETFTFKVIIAIFVGAALGGIIAMSVCLSGNCSPDPVLIQPSTPGPGEDKKEMFTFDDMFNSSLSPKGFSVRWVDGEDAFTYMEDGNLIKFDAQSNSSGILVPKSIFDEINSGTYWLTQDLKFVLFAYERKSKWRRSFDAKYKIYDIDKNSFIDFPNHNTLRGESLMVCQWAPASHKLECIKSAFLAGTTLGACTIFTLTFVYKNNLYYQASPSSLAMQISFVGDVDKHIFVGHTDWVYEEEILGTNYAQWWSPDGRYNSYGFFDEQHLTLFKYPYYGPKTDVYGNIIEIAYPKAGEPEPGRTSKITMWVYDTNTDMHIQFLPPAELANQDHYVTQVKWRDNSHVLIVWTNRIQNNAITTLCSATDGSCTTNYVQTVSGGWIDPGQPMSFLNGSDHYVTILPKDEGASGPWRHVSLIPSKLNATSGSEQFLTSGQEEIKSISGVDLEKNLIYYISTAGDPKTNHLHVVGTMEAAPEDRNSRCLSCGWYSDCEYYSVQFSASTKYYILGCRGPRIPWYRLMRSSDHSVVKVMEDNMQFQINIAKKAMPTRRWLKVPVGGGVMAEATVFIPPGAEDDTTKTHPLLVHTYAGPGSLAVTKAWSQGWQSYLASSEGVVYARIDGRGTTSRGDKHRFYMYRSLGTVEIEDQIAGAQWMKDNLGYVSKTKPGAIWGWSYGGFATLHSIGNNSDTLTCGISGAALIDRRFYDTVYTERTMGLASPEDNQIGYNLTDVTRKIENFRNKKLLLVHGTADDNVHFASSVQMMKALTDAEIQYRLQIYTDQNHYFLSQSRHAYRLFTDFLMNDCWGQSVQSDDEVDTIKVYVRRKDAPKDKKKFVRKEICV